MWRTSRGERALRGPEWALFREGLSSLWDRVEDSPDGEDDFFGLGVRAFDRLPKNQKLWLLAEVGRALKDEATPAPELTACLESAVAAVFRLILQEIELEIEGEIETDDPLCWRRLASEAVAASEDAGEDDDGEGEEGGTPLLPVSTDLDAWAVEVEHLSNLILWDDEDYEMEDEFLDVSPEEAEALRRRLRIDDRYFTAVAADPRDGELRAIRAELMEICERKRSG